MTGEKDANYPKPVLSTQDSPQCSILITNLGEQLSNIKQFLSSNDATDVAQTQQIVQKLH